ncbi:protein PHYTOCHROME KINASE SUBSTRATE 1-like [Macadamia integrifolia]|uniref:protein PHYTOCHROME KINASE SUBSTRATE 1-like n=1 Tax=Macadamia integrifolia TaxID=60698 RepID=UPI001C4E4D46|nr:protein PHYTOCHROME KINASE SUBSTRATE 1-like [Macadamia integrifolia]
MATAALTPACDGNLSRTLTCESGNTHVLDASFSYLHSSEETFILKLAELTRNPSPTFNGAQEPPSHYQISLGRKKTDGEISVFGAEKYFNGGIDDHTQRIAEKVAVKQHQRDERPNLQFEKPQIKHRTPSTCSKVSWNSQSALLPSFLRDQSPNKQNGVQGKRFLSIFGCNCSCSGKKSINVDENAGEIENSRNYRSNVDYKGSYDKEMITMEPTKINQGSIDLVGTGTKQKQFKEEMLLGKFQKLRLSVVGMEKEDEPKKTFDVLGPPIGDLGLNMLAWDTIPKIKDTQATSGSGGNGMRELDMESDASSDLFEIESFSGKVHPSHTRQASDGRSSCVTPSEASIDWSVVTASAANFSTVSDQEERGSVSSSALKSNKTIMSNTRSNSSTAKERRPIMLSGCRSHKAVKVAADAYKMPEKGKNPHPNTRWPGLSDF